MWDEDNDVEDDGSEKRERDGFTEAEGPATTPAINRRDSLSDFRACNNLLALGKSFVAAVEMILSLVN